MIRKAFVMQLLHGQADEYRRRHNPIWPELQATLTGLGVRNYSIFHDGESDRLFAYAEIESEEQWRSIAQTEVCRRWWAYMKPLMQTNPDDSPQSTGLVELFHID